MTTPLTVEQAVCALAIVLLSGCGFGGSDDVEGMREYAARSGLCWDSGHYYAPPCNYASE